MPLNLNCFTKVVAIITGILIIVVAVNRLQNVDIEHF